MFMFIATVLILLGPSPITLIVQSEKVFASQEECSNGVQQLGQFLSQALPEGGKMSVEATCIKPETIEL